MKKLIIIILLFIFINSLFGKMEIDMPFVKKAPKIDGVISEKEWSNAKKIDNFYQIAPGNNSEPSEKTELYTCYDDENIYYLAKCFMKDVSLIRDFRCSRDKIYMTDRVIIFFDTFLSNSQAYYIVANMNGEQADGLVIDDIDPSIDFEFQTEGGKTDYGWFVEIAVPFKSLKYKSGKKVAWGTFIKRMIPARNEEISAFPVNRNISDYYENYGVLKFDNLPKNQNLKISTAMIATINESEEKILNGISDSKDSDFAKEFEPEFNIFYEPNSNLTLLTTINPDYNIIEADGLQVNVNESDLIYYREKRPFFIESTNPFYTDINIYYTRNISSPKWGSKITGNFNNFSLYALAAQDEDVNWDKFFDYGDLTADTYYGFATASTDFFNGNITLRGAATTRVFDKYWNSVYSLDSDQQVTDKVMSCAQISVSTNDNFVEKDSITVVENQQGFAYSYEVEYNNRNWYINFLNKGLSSNYAADLGFIDETDYHYYKNRTEWHKNAETDKSFTRYMEFASTQAFQLNYEMDNIISYYWEPMIGAIFQNRFDFWLGVEYEMEHHYGKDHYLYYPWLSLNYKPWRFLEGSFLLVDGRNYYEGANNTGDFYKYETTLKIRPHNFLDILFQHRFHQTKDFYIVRTYELTTKVQFNKNFWFRIIGQLYSYDDFYYDYSYEDFNLYPLFTYKPSVNMAIYLGANKNKTEENYWNSIEQDENEIYVREKNENKGLNYFLKISYNFDLL